MRKLLCVLPSSLKRVALTVAMKMSGTRQLPIAKANRVGLHALDLSRPLRCCIVGLGAMGRVHAGVLRERSYCQVVGVTSGDPQKRAMAGGLGCRWFESADQMIHSGEVDVVVIATPRWRHAELSVAALEGGLHVVCEKPLALTVSPADVVLQAARHSKTPLTVVFQCRYEPAYQYAKHLSASRRAVRLPLRNGDCDAFIASKVDAASILSTPERE